VQGTAADEEAQAAVEKAMNSTAYDLNMKGIPAPLLPLLPHLRHTTDEALKREDKQTATLANNLGYCLDMLGDYAAARVRRTAAYMIVRYAPQVGAMTCEVTRLTGCGNTHGTVACRERGELGNRVPESYPLDLDAMGKRWIA
jgi:hypothetical protein